jgi:two-component system, cell cycle sensor histidine kinase and response regulator CckA
MKGRSKGEIVPNSVDVLALIRRGPEGPGPSASTALRCLVAKRDMIISERRNMEDALKAALRSAENARVWSEGILEAIGDGISIVDRNFKILYQNDASRELGGSHLGELCYRAYEKKSDECENCYIAQIFEDGKIRHAERCVTNDKGCVCVEITASPLRDASGKIVACIEVVRDITKRKKAEAALQQHLQFLRVLTDTIPVPIFYMDAKGTFSGCNRAFEAVIGMGRDQVIGKAMCDIVPKNVADAYEEADRAHQHQGEQQTYESAVVYADGSVHDIIFNKAVIPNPDGTIGGTVGVMLDITERKKLEAQLIHSQKLEAVGRLAGGIAHDFNNILSVIIGYGAILQKKAPDNESLRFNVDQILAAADRAANLTKSLLAFSRAQVLDPRPIEVNDVIRKMQNLISRIIGEDIELTTKLSSKDTTAMIDIGQIDQVLMNLAANARDAISNGGVLCIETDIVELDQDFVRRYPYGKPGRHVQLTVTDTGTGMDRQTQARIFEPFFTTKETGKGTGLGLAIVYGIVKQHKGYIHVYSEQGLGTTFKIYFPVAAAPAAPNSETPVIPLPEGGSETILLAEDDAPVRSFVRTALASSGYRVIEAVDGEDALQKFQEQKNTIRLLIFDVIMPRMSGKNAYAAIHLLRPDVPILFTSGYPADIIHKHGILDDGLDVVYKPIGPLELLHKVREVIDRGSK